MKRILWSRNEAELATQKGTLWESAEFLLFRQQYCHECSRSAPLCFAFTSICDWRWFFCVGAWFLFLSVWCPNIIVSERRMDCRRSFHAEHEKHGWFFMRTTAYCATNGDEHVWQPLWTFKNDGKWNDFCLVCSETKQDNKWSPRLNRSPTRIETPRFYTILFAIQIECIDM